MISEDAIKTTPFKKEYSDIIVIRHKSNDKWFAVIFTLDKKLYVNLKCKPDIGAVLREQYEEVTPAWHMNKLHWNKVDASKILPEVLDSMIKMSFELTAPKKNSKIV